MKPLATYTQYAHDGEAGVDTMIFPKWIDTSRGPKRFTKQEALEASGMEADGCTMMGAVQKDRPTITATKHSWVVEQTWRANV